MSRKNCGPKLIARIKDLTQNIYGECTDLADSEIGPFEDDGVVSFYEHINAIRQRASALYQARLKSLSTKDLEDILWVHECGKFKRAYFTVENITNELTKRQLDKLLNDD